MDDRLIRLTMPSENRARRLELLQQVFLSQVAMRHGHLSVVENAMGGIDAVAVWLGPGTRVAPADRAALAEARRSLEGDAHRAANAAAATIAALRPADEHFMVARVGTRVDRRRRGLGRAVLHPLVREADETEQPVFAPATSRLALEFLEAMGFEAQGHARLPSGADVWGMVRPPRRLRRPRGAGAASANAPPG
ncbi:MAG: hypothetical protein HYX34_11850 [Actinobacteria bacterium]|nr:hypothetical protein [Actinomycetota bacterium]